MAVVFANTLAIKPKSTLTIGDIDLSPTVQSINEIRFTNGAVTDEGGGIVSVATTVGGSGDVSSNTAVSVDGEVALFSGIGGKTLKRSTLTGILKAVAGVQQAATPGVDYAPATVGTTLLKGDNSGAFADAIAGTDYLVPAGNGSQLTNITKGQVGLGNVDNTSDVNKPISSAAQTALDLKAPKAFPVFTGDIRSTFLGTENFIIDARTSPRLMTAGVLRLNHTAGIAGTRPLTLDVDCNGYGDTHALVIDYKATGITTGDMHLLGITIDTANSTGGDINGISVSKVGTGLANVTGLEVYPGCTVVHQHAHAGVAQTLTRAWILASAIYTDVTTAFANGTNVGIFTNDSDYIICGYDTAFDHLEIVLQTLASTSVTPIFEYSTGDGTWNTFVPADGSNGFTTNGTIAWGGSLAGWVSANVNGVSKYYIRIQRTRNQLTTTPIEGGITLVSNPQHYEWDKNGDLTVRRITTLNALVYPDNATALAGGLTVGQTYRTATGVLMIVY